MESFPAPQPASSEITPLLPVRVSQRTFNLPRRPPNNLNHLFIFLLSILLFISLHFFFYAALSPSDAEKEVGGPNPGEKEKVGPTYPDSMRIEGPMSPLLHDPGICVVEGGEEDEKIYILVSSGVGLPVRTSRDRVNWSAAGFIFPTSAPSSTNRFTGVANGNLWAPDITHIPSRGFFLYYAASSLGSRNSGIFLATSADGKEWKDGGVVLESGERNEWNAIDPNLAKDPETGEWWLVFGSYWGGTCCDGSQSTYSIHVTRSNSSSILGPYFSQAGIPALEGAGDEILGGHGNVVGPGGQSVFMDDDGPVMVYHYSAEKPHMYHIGMNKVEFRDGWPVVA
ncbi:hypothetical protein P7C70_g2367, partial [Phenoliferia sp. Uapishka_3]